MKKTPICQEPSLRAEEIANAALTMPSEDALFSLADLYKLFGDRSRLRILFALYEAERCVCELASLCGLTVSAVSHQLRILKQARLVKHRRSGKSVFYSLSDLHVHRILEQGMEHITE